MAKLPPLTAYPFLARSSLVHPSLPLHRLLPLPRPLHLPLLLLPTSPLAPEIRPLAKIPRPRMLLRSRRAQAAF